MESTELTMFTETIRFQNSNIWIKPVCDFFKLDVQNQYTKIKNDPILGKLYGKNSTVLSQNNKLVGKNTPDLGEIDKNGRVLLSKKGFVRWIQIINANTIVDHLREKFILYQSLVFDFIYGSFEQEQQIKVDYQRLKKLKHLYSTIGREIQRVETNVKRYMDSRFCQLSLPLNDTQQIES